MSNAHRPPREPYLPQAKRPFSASYCPQGKRCGDHKPYLIEANQQLNGFVPDRWIT